jgi:SAM-dependent methyltransferase
MMKSQDDMIVLNVRQAQFYNKIQEAEATARHGGYSHNADANALTRLIASLRYQQQRAVESTGLRDRVRQTHLQWLRQRAGGSFLEIGCFSGSDYTFDLIDIAGDYTGIELSGAACVALQKKMKDNGVPGKASVVCGDFLAYQRDRRFDIIYAHGVLHHFENPEPLFVRIRDLIADDGFLVFVEPVAINPVFRLLRSAYRPFQSDAAWEWPFRRETVFELVKRFEIVDGYGWGRFSAPITTVCGIPLVGAVARPIYRWIARKEVATAHQRGYWHSSMVIAKCRPI